MEHDLIDQMAPQLKLDQLLMVQRIGKLAYLNAKGQALFGRMVADTLVRTQVELGPDVVGEPTKPKSAATQ